MDRRVYLDFLAERGEVLPYATLPNPQNERPLKLLRPDSRFDRDE